ncbi:MAG: hypothetical protein WA655_05550 [Candidatus Korobacteraceae bacterium]
MKVISRVSAMLAIVLVLATIRFGMPALAAGAPEVILNIQNTAPRQVEDTTEKAIARDYAAAWQSMTSALDQNRTDLLNANFIGTASEKLTATIAEQSKAGLHQRFVDKGHKADVVFYSPEGSAIELQDTAQLEIQLLDGDKVVHSEAATIHYVVLLTASADSWKVRVLEAVPAF